MKLVNRYLSWVTVRYDGLDGGFRLLGTALVEMLGGEVDFSVDGFEMDFCLYPAPVLRRFWKDPLMTPTPTTPLQASFTATPLPIHHPFPLP